jgi:mono/diheme cytochrome c family protein
MIRSTRRLVPFTLALGLVPCPSRASDAKAPPAVVHITAVEGVSWRNRLKVPFEQSAMGRMGIVSSGPGPTVPVGTTPESLEEPFVLSGSDLYRLNCQSCHNVGGSGSPPEIRSLIDPVRATSVEITREQLKRRGAELTEAAIQQMADQAKASLMDRLSNGGERMPPFRHLESSEVEALLSYLRELAGVTQPRGTPLTVTEPVARVGEQVVKGNCFICHDATGPGSDAMVSVPQLIPSLASFPEQKSASSFALKVRVGAPAPGTLGRTGRMPVFSYLTDQEVKAAYIYLVEYPPHEGPHHPAASPSR